MPALDDIPSMMSLYSERCSPCKTQVAPARARSANNRALLMFDGIGCGPGVADTGITSGLSAGAAAALELAVETTLGVSAGSA